MRKRKKKAECKSLELLALGCPKRQNAPGIRIPGVSCLASGRSGKDAVDRDRQSSK